MKVNEVYVVDVYNKGSKMALFPFLVFFLIFIGIGLIKNDFYEFPVIVAILIASIVALMMNRKVSLQIKIEEFCKGAGHSNVMLMVFIFLLAGAFSEVAKGMGAVESTVHLTLSIVPSQLLLAGLFVIACFISLSMGTSVGTIVALVPIGVGVSEQASLPLALTVATVIGGAMFGDNLSFISDTTIAAVRTQYTQMKDKFKTNFFIVLPAAIITCIILAVITTGEQVAISTNDYSWIKIIPYMFVLIAAIIGVNVLIVLISGTVIAGLIGLIDGSYKGLEFFKTVGVGMENLYEMSLLAMLIAGMVSVIRLNGGIDYLLYAIKSKIKTKKGAQFGIASLISLTNMATANNTIAIVSVGPLAKEIADEYEIDPRYSASILDIFSCFIQGILPYGAQILVAAGIASISPMSIIPYSIYPVLTGICAVVAIIFVFDKKKTI